MLSLPVPEPPPTDAAPNCAEAGAGRAACGVIGLLQATERRSKLLLGIGEPLRGRLLQFDALSMGSANPPACRPAMPGLRAGFRIPWVYDYAAFCAEVA